MSYSRTDKYYHCFGPCLSGNERNVSTDSDYRGTLFLSIGDENDNCLHINAIIQTAKCKMVDNLNQGK